MKLLRTGKVVFPLPQHTVENSVENVDNRCKQGVFHLDDFPPGAMVKLHSPWEPNQGAFRKRENRPPKMTEKMQMRRPAGDDGAAR